MLLLGCGGNDKVPPGAVFKSPPIYGWGGSNLSHRFNLVNTTGKPVRILGEQHSCSCTRVEYEKTTSGTRRKRDAPDDC